MRHAVLPLFATLLIVACGARSATPPVIVVDRTACHHCGMLISDRRHAAAVRTADGDRLFDDIGCLINSLKGRVPDGASLWFNDATTGEWITGTPTFVTSKAFRTPMAGGIQAYGDRAAADRAAASHQGTIASSFESLLARAGAEK